MNDNSAKLTEFLDNHLPIAGYMGLAVEGYDGRSLILQAPLAPNINDKQTAFGGSLCSAGMLACWGLVYLRAQDAGLEGNQLITKSNIEFKAPVTGDIRAICDAPDETVMAAFIERFREQGKARISLASRIECSGRVAVELQAEFALLAPR